MISPAVRRRWAFPALGAAFFLAGLALTVMPYLSWDFSTLPGGLDTRFNQYILEHGYLWLTGRQASFWQAPFFYPYPLPVALSDSHIGTLPLYALFRFAGLGPDAALPGWIVLMHLLNFIAAAWVLRRWRFGMFAAAAGAYLFTFAMPATAQLSHIQLLFRCMIPPAVCFAGEFWRRPDDRSFILTAVAVFWQFAASIYLGSMLIFGIVTMSAVIAIRERRTIDWKKILIPPRPSILYRTLTVVAFLFGVGGIMAPYFSCWQYLTIAPSLSMSLFILPHWANYFQPCADSFFWQWLYSLISIDYYKAEGSMFAGLAALIAALAALPALRRRDDSLLPVFLISWLLLIALTLQIGGFSVYGLLKTALPWLGSIRSVPRICLVFLLFQSVCVAWLIDALLKGGKRLGLRPGWLAACFIGLLLLEGAVFRTHGKYRPAEARAEVELLKAQLTDLPPGALFLCLPGAAETRSNGEINLDAMVAAQELRLFTINGYSGHNPPGWFPYGPQFISYRRELQRWMAVSVELFHPNHPELRNVEVEIVRRSAGP